MLSIYILINYQSSTTGKINLYCLLPTPAATFTAVGLGTTPAMRAQLSLRTDGNKGLRGNILGKQFDSMEMNALQQAGPILPNWPPKIDV